MNTKSIGDISEAMIIARLMKSGKIICVPFGDNQRYDILIDNGNCNFSRVQCKTGKLKGDVIIYPTSSSAAHRGGKRNSYVGDVEYIAVYCHDNDQVYLIPIEDCTAGFGTLRLIPPKNNQVINIKYAETYLII